MTTKAEMPAAERILQLLHHLGIEQAHFATRGLGDLTGLAAQHPELFASLTLVCPGPPSRDIVGPLASKLLVYKGDATAWDDLGRVMDGLPKATVETLDGWESWSDLVVCHKEEIKSTMLPFLARHTTAALPPANLVDGARGAVAGISYHIQGTGPPLVLLPLGLFPSQWDPLMPALTEAYCTITLGGAELGIAALLEKRASLDGYLGMVRSVIQEAAVQPGESILEVGCGTGALTRWLAQYTEGQNAVTGLDLNHYLLREAGNLTRMAELDGQVCFEHGNAEELPYPDNAFDLTLSVTVLEEVDADRALAEMIRVTRPGGRVAVIVRAMDVPFFLNMPLGEALKAKLDNPKEWVSAGPRGCADASLYRKLQASDLTDVKMFPYLAVFARLWVLDLVQDSIIPILNQAEAAEWQTARVQAVAESTFFWSYPHHCAVGTIPA